MPLQFLPLLVQAEEKFMRAPGIKETGEVFLPGEQSLNVVVEGAYGYLSSGIVTLIVLPVLAAILYRTGFRVAAPIVVLITLGLFLSRMLGSPA